MPYDVEGREALDTHLRGAFLLTDSSSHCKLSQLCCSGLQLPPMHFFPQHALPLPGFIFLASDIYDHVVLFNKSGKSGVMWQDSLPVSEAKPHFYNWLNNSFISSSSEPLLLQMSRRGC